MATHLNSLCMSANSTSIFTWIAWKHKPLLVTLQHLWEYNQHKKWNRKKLKATGRVIVEISQKKNGFGGGCLVRGVVWGGKGSLEEITWQFSDIDPFSTQWEIRFIKYQQKTTKVLYKTILQNLFKDSRSVDFSKKLPRFSKLFIISPKCF